jgi:hypothetical protein
MRRICESSSTSAESVTSLRTSAEALNDPSMRLRVTLEYAP